MGDRTKKKISDNENLTEDKINTYTLRSVLLNNDLHLKCSLFHFLCQQSTQKQKILTWTAIELSSLFRVYYNNSGSILRMDNQDEISFFIVLLKMKAREKSRHSPFVVNTSVSWLQLACSCQINLAVLDPQTWPA